MHLDQGRSGGSLVPSAAAIGAQTAKHWTYRENPSRSYDGVIDEIHFQQ